MFEKPFRELIAYVPRTHRDGRLETRTLRNELNHNSVSFAGAVALSAAFMGPAVSAFYYTVPATGVCGCGLPALLHFFHGRRPLRCLQCHCLLPQNTERQLRVCLCFRRPGNQIRFHDRLDRAACLCHGGPSELRRLRNHDLRIHAAAFAVQVSWIWIFFDASLSASLQSCFASANRPAPPRSSCAGNNGDECPIRLRHL